MNISVSTWLTDLGLSSYLEVFEANDIDSEVLFDLTDPDLEKMGVSLGHRKKMLKAIARERALRESTEVKPDATNLPPQHKAEYRYITVMFCDLVGSTALTHRLGAERMREINRRYQVFCKKIIDQFDGFVARYMGDGILAYFGYPVALEDAAERAVRAGMEIIENLSELNADILGSGEAGLEVRVGVASGQVVVDEIDTGAWQERNAVGNAPNLAARLQDLADPGHMIIADDTRQLVGDVFRYESCGTHELKGIPEPVAVWRILGTSSLESRFTATRGRVHGQIRG